MTNTERYRPNVGIMLVNQEHRILVGEAFHYPGDWMMPQGGIAPEESPQDAMRRELYEETGLNFEQVGLLKEHEGWIRYRFPKPQYKDDIFYVGQDQKWFLLECDCSPAIEDRSVEREFSDFQWVEPNWLIEHTYAFRRDLYQEVIDLFRPCFP